MIWFAHWLFVDPKASVYTVSKVAFALAFIVNHPHFISSYILLYSDFKKSVLTKPRYVWAGLIVPSILFSYLAYSIVNGRADYLGYAVSAMFVLVGWHYVKQVFGCMIVSSAQRKIYYSGLERKLLLANLFLVWAMSLLRSHLTGSTYGFYGIQYTGLSLPQWTMDVVYAGTAITLLGLVLLFANKFIKQGKVMTWGGAAAFLSLYVWNIPAFAHPSFSYYIPMFHSLQYLALVWVFKKNQTTEKAADLSSTENRKVWMKSFVGFFVSATVLGALFFQFIPSGLDSLKLTSDMLASPQVFMATFLLFINIHHYFIDNVIWRSDNLEVKKHLFTSPSVSVETPPSSKSTALAS